MPGASCALSLLLCQEVCLLIVTQSDTIVGVRMAGMMTTAAAAADGATAAVNGQMIIASGGVAVQGEQAGCQRGTG